MVKEYDVDANTLLQGILHSGELDVITIDRENREKLRLNVTGEANEELVEAVLETLK